MQQTDRRDTYPLLEKRFADKWEKLIWRLNKLEAGKRYQIMVTVGQEPDWTITELGKVER